MILVETLELLSKARQYVEQGEQCMNRPGFAGGSNS
jgi:hypothetical protein